MSFRDEELAFPGNREVIERELGKSTTQVAYLVPVPSAGHRTLHELGVDAIRGVEFVRREEDPATGGLDGQPASAAVPSNAEAIAAKDGVAPDMAEAYAKAKAEVKAILANHTSAETAS